MLLLVIISSKLKFAHNAHLIQAVVPLQLWTAMMRIDNGKPYADRLSGIVLEF